MASAMSSLVVLIVAKCNVNISKKFIDIQHPKVLIVAKCNVNKRNSPYIILSGLVLIVAKCNVNMAYNNDFDLNVISINSSKV